jgi:hypothetical protein
MSTNQNDFVIDNGTGFAVRTDIQDALQALAGNSSGNTEPSVKYAYQWWADSNDNVMKLRNSANNAWIELFQLDGTLTLEDGSASTPGLAFRDDLNTGIFSSAENHVNFATNGVERIDIGTDDIVVNNGGADLDFRIEGDTDANLFKVDAGNDRVGIGIASPFAKLTIFGNGGDEARVVIEGEGGADPYLNFLANNATHFSIGIDDSDSDKFKISKHSALGTNDFLVINTSGDVGIGTAIPDTPLTVSRATTGNVLKGLSTNNNTRSRIELEGKDGSGNAVTLITGGEGDFGGMVFTHTNHNLGFATNNSAPQMILNTSGHFLFNCTSLPSASVAGLAFEKNGNTGVIFHSSASTANANVGEFFNSNGVVGRITTSGSNCSFTDVSDYRLKENEVAISDGITRLKQLKPYRFNYKTDSSQTFDGFFAHEAQTVVPESVVGEKDATNKDGSINPQCIDQSKLVPLLTAALQEAIAKIEVLETEVAALKAA